MTLNYHITFLSDWHCGSGLSGGAEADATVLKDNQKLPFIPGKTIKGLIKEALSEMREVNETISQNQIDSILGKEIRDPKDPKKVIGTINGSAFFSNAELSEEEKKEITHDLTDFLYRNIASTQIEKNKGTAKWNSLRVMEVCIPVTLEGKIIGITSDEQYQLLTDALKWIRHLGVNRNRGLGRCKLVVT
jgi:hypothetical protein